MLKGYSFLMFVSAFNVNSITRLLLHADVFWFCNAFDRLSVCEYTLRLRCKPKISDVNQRFPFRVELLLTSVCKLSL